jgi:P27 family predicted phage terminase small subunit
MKGRPVVPLPINKHHFTQAERQKRQTAETRLMGGADKVRPPSWLDKTAKQEFKRLAVELIRLKIICNIDIGGLAIACDAYSKYILATQALTGTTINAQVIRTVENQQANETTTMKKNPLNAVEKFAVIYRQYCAEYGLTPVARIRISSRLVEEKQHDNTGYDMFGDNG